MEYLEGENLEARLKRGPLPLTDSVSIGIEIAEALDKAHREGVIHRDLKPANVILTESGAKLVDFGVAKIVEEEEKGVLGTKTTTDQSSQTKPGQVVGTPSYMSPEQVRGGTIDQRTDIWSLGVILYQMVCGQMPFAGPTASDVISLILLKEPPPLPLGSREVPTGLTKVVQKALEKDRERRYQSAHEILSDLKRYKQKHEIEGEIERLGAPPQTSEAGKSDSLAGDDNPRIPAYGQPMSPSLAAQVPFVLGTLDRIKQHKLALISGLCVVAAAAAGTISIQLSAVILGVAGSAIALYAYFSRTDSVAVMPFTWTVVSGGVPGEAEREYLSDGITESIINSLSRFDNLKVISRTSVFRYKGKEIDPPEVARKLDVRIILTGRIFQKGPTLAISVEMIDARENKAIWGEQYERPFSSLASLQREIAWEISRNLKARGPDIANPNSQVAESYEAYLKGKFYFNKRTGEDIQKAIECYQRAVTLDPNYALAYAGLAECHALLGVYSNTPLREAYAQASHEIRKALEIDDSLAEAHAVLGLIKAGDDWDLAGALGELAKAIHLNPNYATAHHWYAEYLACAGKTAQAVAEVKRAQELDPLSLVVSTALGFILFLTRDYDRAIAQLYKTIEMDKNFYLAHRILRDAYVEKGMHEEAFGEYRLARTLAGEPPARTEAVVNSLKEGLSSAGPRGYWQKRLELATQDMESALALPYDVTDTSPYHLANIYARLGHFDLATKWLDKAFLEGDYGLYYLKTNPAFDALRNDPKVRDLMRRIGLV